MADKCSAAPAQSGAIEIRRGTAVGVLTPSTDADFDYINANLRPLDRFEQNHFLTKCGVDRPDSLDLMETSYTLHLRGEIVGYVALQLPPMGNTLATARFVPMLSTVNVAHHTTDFIRLSRPILERVISRAPAWVTDFYSLPLARYEATVRWHEKTMGWHRVMEMQLGGEKAILFHIARKEIEK